MKKSPLKPLSEAARAARRANAAKGTEAAKRAVDERRAAAAQALESAGVPPFAVSEARLMAAKAKLAEIDRDERLGELVSVAEAEAHWADTVTLIKTRILGVPARVAQRLPALAASVVPVLDELLREALEEIAADGGTVDE